jgi:uncharacterized protein YccT (UPF0319 family)
LSKLEHILALAAMFPFSTKKLKLCKVAPNEHSYQAWFKLAQKFQRRRFKTNNTLLTPLGLLFLLCTSNQQKKTNTHELSKGPSNEQSYQFWFKLAQKF